MARPTCRRRSPTVIELMVVVAMLGIGGALFGPAACQRQTSSQTNGASSATATAEREDDDTSTRETLAMRLKPASADWRDGLAAVVLVDVSGSMKDRVRDANGDRQRKLVIAQRAARDLVQAFASYAAAHPNEEVSVGVFEFSQRNGEPNARVVIPPGKPDPSTAEARLESMKAVGGTPIGDAMVEGRLALDATRLRRRHLLVITDGENTDGVSPAIVARVMETQDDAVRAPLYFVAFDVAASAFEGVKRHGGLLLSAKDGGELRTTLDELLSDRILVEAPRK